MKKTIVFVKNSNATEVSEIKQFIGGEVLVLHRPTMTKEVEICELDTIDQTEPKAPVEPVVDTTEPPIIGSVTVRPRQPEVRKNQIHA